KDRHHVSSSGPSSSIRKAKHTSDDGFRGTADSAMFRNQSCPHYPFLFLQPPVQLNHAYNYVLTRALIQQTNINSLSIHTPHTHIDCRLLDTSSFAPSFPLFSYAPGCHYYGSLNTSWYNQLLVFLLLIYC
ncbi:unnamed protein product, partial [Hymenolepis diminuta]